LKTPNRNATPHLAPTVPLDQLIDDAFQSDAVQWISRMRLGIRHKSLFLQIFRNSRELSIAASKSAVMSSMMISGRALPGNTDHRPIDSKRWRDHQFHTCI